MDTSMSSSMFTTTQNPMQNLGKQLAPAIAAVVGITIPLVVMMVLVWRYSRGYRLVPLFVSKRLPSHSEPDLEAGSNSDDNQSSNNTSESGNSTRSAPLPSIPLFCGTAFAAKIPSGKGRRQESPSEPMCEVQRSSMGMSLPCVIDADGFSVVQLGFAHVLK